MKYRSLGRTDVSVSEICLGTMTWGIQNNQQDADSQLAVALDAGINFIDTAEMYPVPPNQETYGDTERILGDWLQRNANQREHLTVMTKIAGPGLRYIREGRSITESTIPVALEDSLTRLKSEYIDVYQLHWSNRQSAHFGKHWPNQCTPTSVDIAKEKAQMAKIVVALGDAIKAGKIRHWGLSDETTWGIHTYLTLCKELNVPYPVSIQNEFNLLHIKDWPYLIESCVFEDIAYLPWSPLAGGMLSGKYLDGKRPEGSRWTMVQRQGLFRDNQYTQQAVADYVALASQWNMTPSQLALAWCRQVDGVTSTIIGATTIQQLHEDISAFELELTDSQCQQVLAVLQRYPIPF